jgi:hypothetical protein
LSTSALSAAVDFLAKCSLPAVRLHAARTLGAPRRFGSIQSLKEDAFRDMFARDVRELFLLPYVQAWRTCRLRGAAAGVLGPVLSGNGSVALDALLARGCLDPNRAVSDLLDGMLERWHPRGYFYEPHQAREAEEAAGRRRERRFTHVTATYLRFLLAFGRGRDPRIRGAFDWLVEHQDEDGAWRPSPLGNETESYVLTRSVVQAFAGLPAPSLKRWGAARRRLESAWSQRILERCEAPDAVLPYLNIGPDPLAPPRRADGPDLPAGLGSRILYFPLEDLALAVTIGAKPTHPNLAPWIEWLHDSQLADGSWRLGDPSLRERLLLSDPNGRLRAEALYLTDEWITLRGAQVMKLVHQRTRDRSPVGAD